MAKTIFMNVTLDALARSGDIEQANQFALMSQHKVTKQDIGYFVLDEENTNEQTPVENEKILQK
jgi:hypothetical protein